MRTPPLNALRAFHAVARLGSLTLAADELCVTTSAVSRQIKHLEEYVGVALVTRDGRRGLRLTADGAELQKGLSDAFAQIHDALARFDRTSRGERLRIAVPPVFASVWLLPRISRFEAARPSTDIILLEHGEKADIREWADISIVWGYYKSQTAMIVEPLSHKDEVFPVCVRDHCGNGSLDGAVLLHRETVEYAPGWPDWSTFLSNTGLTPVGIVNGPSLSPGLMLDATRQGRGVMLTNTICAYDDIAAGRLVRPIPESMTVEGAYSLLTARAAGERAEVRAFRHWIKKEFEDFDRRP